MLYETKFLISLGTTSVIEIPIIFILVKYVFEKKNKSLKSWKILLIAFLASVITLPYLWFVLPPFVDARLYILYGEILVAIAETFIIAFLLDIQIFKALIISIAANSMSYFLGKYILAIIGKMFS